MRFIFSNINKCYVHIDYSVEPSLASFKEEIHAYLKDLYQNNKEITLFFSGGMDSRFLARCMLDLNIPFKAYTYVFSKTKTDYDSLVSTKFCTQYNIEHETIFLDKDKLFEHIKKLYDKEIVFTVRNNYYMSFAANAKIEDGYNGIFLTGAASEFKIEDNKISFPYNVLHLQQQYNNIFNFTTDRIFLAYINNTLFKENYNNTSIDWTDIRIKIYQEAYSDLEVIEKTQPEEDYIADEYCNFIDPFLVAKAPVLFVTEEYKFDLDEYYNTRP